MINPKGGGYMYDAIILAGGENSEHLSKFSSQSYEAMIEIAGKPMVTFVADALAATSQVERILIVGPVTQLVSCDFPANTILIEGGNTITQTIQLGIEALGHERKVLIVTADIPLLTPAAITDFLNQCSKIEADLALVDLEAAGRVRSLGRARAQRWVSPPLVGFTTILLLPAALPPG
jgi:bifunctional N-acetylglucosamine-1-phosphate-uridyltransferase/glucosamine-1-phosphate-acetyltransferase GlmU-like protein